jgi:hypothetical protein
MSYKVLLLIALFMPVLLVAAGRWIHSVDRAAIRVRPRRPGLAFPQARRPVECRAEPRGSCRSTRSSRACAFERGDRRRRQERHRWRRRIEARSCRYRQDRASRDKPEQAEVGFFAHESRHQCRMRRVRCRHTPSTMGPDFSQPTSDRWRWRCVLRSLCGEAVFARPRPVTVPHSTLCLPP